MKCNKCKKEKQETEFYPSSRGVCKVCQLAINEKWKQDNAERHKKYQQDYHKDYRLKRKMKREQEMANIQPPTKEQEEKAVALYKQEQDRKAEESRLHREQRNNERLARRAEKNAAQKKFKQEQALKKKQEQERFQKEIDSKPKAPVQREDTGVPPSLSKMDFLHERPRAHSLTIEMTGPTQRQDQLRKIGDYFNRDFMIFDSHILAAITEAKCVVEDDHEHTYVTITYRTSKKKRVYAEDLSARRSGEDRPPQGREIDD